MEEGAREQRRAHRVQRGDDHDHGEGAGLARQHEEEVATKIAETGEAGQEEEGRGEEEAEGLKIARELCAAVRPLVQGILVAAPDGDVARALEVK